MDKNKKYTHTFPVLLKITWSEEEKRVFESLLKLRTLHFTIPKTIKNNSLCQDQKRK